MNEADLEEIIWGDAEGWEAVTSKAIIGQRRWSTSFEQVFKRTDDGTFWEISWSRGSTETQDNGLEDITYRQVSPVQKNVTVYE